MVVLLRAVTKLENLHSHQSLLHSELRSVMPAGRYRQYGMCRVHDEPGGEQTVCEETATSLDTPRGSFIVADEFAAWDYDL